LNDEVTMENWIDSRIAFSGKIFQVRTGNVSLQDGSNAQRDIVDHSGGVAIVPIIGDEVVLIRQFRISIGREIIELPAGKLEQDEKPEVCARRELEEEIGFKVGRLVLAQSYYSSVGFTNERMYVYLGFDLEETEKKLEWDEYIQVIRLPISEVKSKLFRGEFEDSKTIIGLSSMLIYLENEV